MTDETQEFDNNQMRGESPDKSQPAKSEATEGESSQWPGLEPDETRELGTPDRKQREQGPLTDLSHWPNIEGYVIQEYLGGGGFGDVFKARSVKLGGPVAIKILRPQYSLDEIVTKRFQQEVQAAAVTRHAHVVQVLDTDISTNPPYENCRYLVTEYLSGGDFAHWLKEHSPPTAHLNAIIRILIGVCRGLEAIHRNGIVHRDLKPDNILLDRDGVAKVGDFGLSVLDLENEFRLTGSDQIFGTLPYMAPEQILSAKNAVPASDQYAVGVMLYVVLCKLRPWQESTKDENERSRILSNLTSTPPAPVAKDRRIDKRLQDICLQCLQPLPEDRYPNVQDLRLDLEAWLHDESNSIKVTHKRSRKLPIVAAALMLLAIGLVYLVSFVTSNLIASNETKTSPESVSLNIVNESSAVIGDPYIHDREVVRWVRSLGGRATDPFHAVLEESVDSEAPCIVGYIDLSGSRSFQSQDLSRLTRLPRLSYVALPDTSLDPEGLSYLAECPNLRWLKIQGTKLTSKDFRRLEKLRHLSYFGIDSSQVDDDWAFLSTLPSLRTLSIHGDIDASVKRLGEFRNLSAIGFTDTNSVPDEIIESLQNQNPLLVLRLRPDPDLQDVNTLGTNPIIAAAKQLTQDRWNLQSENNVSWNSDSSIEWMQIKFASAPFGRKLTTQDFDHLGTLGVAEFWLLHLAGCKNLDDLPRFLQGRKIGHLNLVKTDLSDELLLKIGQSTSLTSIKVNDTLVTHAGVLAFKNLRPTCRVFSSFGELPPEHRLPGEPDAANEQASELKHTPLVANDAYAREREALKWVLSAGGKAFDSEYRRLEIEAANQTNFSINNIHHLGFGGTVSLNNKELERIAGLPGLSFLSMHGAALDSTGMSHILKNQNLKDLDLRHTNIKPDDLERLSVLPHLSKVYVNSYQLPEGWGFLGKLPSLRSLEVSGPSNDPPAIIELDISDLGKHRQLRQLRFSDAIKISRSAIDAVQDDNPELELLQWTTGKWIRRGSAPKGRISAAKQLADKGWTFKGKGGDGSEWNQDAPGAWDPNQRVDFSEAVCPPDYTMSPADTESLSAIPLTDALTLRAARGLKFSRQMVRSGQPLFCKLEGSDATDEDLLELGRTGLWRAVMLEGTKVTLDGIKKFKDLQPTCAITSSPFGKFPPENRFPEPPAAPSDADQPASDSP